MSQRKRPGRTAKRERQEAALERLQERHDQAYQDIPRREGEADEIAALKRALGRA